jgi:hypothetical protein
MHCFWGTHNSSTIDLSKEHNTHIIFKCPSHACYIYIILVLLSVVQVLFFIKTFKLCKLQLKKSEYSTRWIMTTIRPIRKRKINGSLIRNLDMIHWSNFLCKYPMWLWGLDHQCARESPANSREVWWLLESGRIAMWFS